jgi:hypothetical protein
MYPVINDFINNEWEKLRQKHIPWSLMRSGKPFRCTNFYGKNIQDQGVAFEGSPREVFWGRYIEPFLEDISNRAIDQAIRFSNEKDVSHKSVLLETSNLLKILVQNNYDLMTEIDQRLRGQGYPQRVAKLNVEAKIVAMDRFIDSRVQSEIAMIKKQWKIDEFYKKHPFLFWFIPLAIGAAIWIAKLFLG